MSAAAAGGAPTFLLDEHLKHIARWLRLMGYDAALRDGPARGPLFRQLAHAGRVLVTTSREAAANAPKYGAPVHRLSTVDSGPALRELIQTFRLRPELTYDRCTLCNVPVEVVAKADIAHRLPPQVAAATDAFHRCPSCGRVYWRLSHTEHLERAFAGYMEPLTD